MRSPVDAKRKLGEGALKARPPCPAADIGLIADAENPGAIIVAEEFRAYAGRPVRIDRIKQVIGQAVPIGVAASWSGVLLDAKVVFQGISPLLGYFLRGSQGIDRAGEIGRASCRKECRSRWSPYH